MTEWGAPETQELPAAEARLSYALIKFEPAQGFSKSRREFSLVWPEAMIVDES